MALSSRLRGVAAVVMGLIITAAFGLFILFFGLVVRFLTDWLLLNWGRNTLEQMPKYWSAVMHRVCTRGILQVRLEITGAPEPVKPGEVTICVANHPSTLAVHSFFWFVTQRISSRLVVVAKREHLTNPLAPFVGWALWAMRGGIFIDRANPESAFESIRQGIEDARARDATFVIFPDMRRPTPQRIAEDRAAFHGRIPWIDHWLYYTMVPRIGGLLEIFKALEQMDVPVRLVDITNAFDMENNGVVDAGALCGSSLHFVVEEMCPKSPYEKDGIAQYLNSSWNRKNQRIALWRSENSH